MVDIARIGRSPNSNTSRASNTLVYFLLLILTSYLNPLIY